jgi:hypothetical protein
MAYTKRQAVEQAYNIITGGGVRDEMNVEQADLWAHVASACYAVLGVDIQQRKQYNNSLRRSGTIRAIDYSDLCVTQEVISKFDENRDRPYIDIPNHLATVGGDLVFSVMPVQGDYFFCKAQSFQAVRGLELTGNTWYVFEGTPTGQRIWFSSLPVESMSVLLTTIIDFDAWDDDKPLPVPSDKETMLIDLLVKSFLGEFNTQDDKLIDQTKNVQPMAQQG